MITSIHVKKITASRINASIGAKGANEHRLKRFSSLFFAVMTMLTVFFPACGGIRSSRFSYTFFGAFDTAVTVTAFCERESEFNELSELCENELAEYHKLYDIYNDYDGICNIKTINDNAGGEAIVVDGRIIELLEFGVDMYEISEGRLNIMLGSVIRLWHECRENATLNPESAVLPDSVSLQSASEHCKIESLIIDKENSTVAITDDRAGIDVGAIAKGFALMKLKARLVEEGYDNVLINAGGNIFTIGSRGDGQAWNAAVQDPDNAEGYVGNKPLNGESLATSGDYQRYYTVDGVRYNHIVSPFSLYPADFVKSATICATDPATADALSTIVFLMDEEQGLAFVEELKDTEALIVTKNNEVLFTSGW